MSFTPAKPVSSSQETLHHKLQETVIKHCSTIYRKPIAKHSQRAFDFAQEYWLTMGRPDIVLDSACGTAESTRQLAKRHSDCLVIGLDQSEQRLANSRNAQLPDNLLLLRCDCVDFWRLVDNEGLTIGWHYLFYPNPYPKAEHLKRRWHGHPVFFHLLQISERLELRTNWRLYAQEFYAALDIVGYGQIKIQEYFPENAQTAFERKYQISQHRLWQVLASQGG